MADNNNAKRAASPSADDPADLFARLDASLQFKMKILEEETEKLQTEKDIMNSIVAKNNIQDEDIIEINAGGKFTISTTRSTLCLAEGSVFANMFSGRWEQSLKRDSEGRVFFDHDPELIEIIVNFLRRKKIEDPSRPTKSTPNSSREGRTLQNTT